MLSSRMLVRMSVLLNTFLLGYFFIGHLSSPVVEEKVMTHHRNLESVVEESGDYTSNSRLESKLGPNAAPYVAESFRSNDVGLSELEEKKIDANSIKQPASVSHKVIPEALKSQSPPSSSLPSPSSPPLHPPADDCTPYKEPPRAVQERAGVAESLVAAPIANEVSDDPPSDSLQTKMYPQLKDCVTKPLDSFTSQRGDFWVLENYIPAALSFRCDESITYTTHGDYTFLDNLETLTSRWQGPVSIAVYAPGEDFAPTLSTILHLRDCWAEGIRKFVTFHLVFHTDHVPKQIPSTESLLQRKIDCSVDPPHWTNVTTYRRQKKLVYPVNVARNVARRTAQTFFIFPSDVELYPSINFIPEFFKMLKRPDISKTTKPKVFVFSIFEVKETVTAPETKKELLAMLKTGDAIPFHKKVCARCHKVPHSDEWLKKPGGTELHALHVGKRLGTFNKWEPIYVGTHREPLYDERLSWEGKSDKMTQMYILCVRDYEFLILDNAFLVHRPGIKHLTKEKARDAIVVKQNSLIKKHIWPEYKVLFGHKKECIV